MMTLDGYFEGPKPWEIDYHDYVWGEELERFSLEQAKEVGVLLFGRRPYEGMAAYWSKARRDCRVHEQCFESCFLEYARGGHLEQHSSCEGQSGGRSGPD